MPRATLKQRPDGRYMCKFKGVFFYGATQTEALKKRDQYKRDLEKGLRAQEAGVTVREYSERWIKIHKAEASRRTYNEYAHRLNVMCELIGDMRMRDVTATDIKAVYNSRIGMSRSEITHFTQTVRAVFRSANADNIIAGNPTLDIKKPKGEAGSHRALEPWERDLVCEMAATGHRLGLAFLVMMYSGVRRGEVLALNIDRDIDFKENWIHVREAVHYDSNQPIVGDTKTDAGVRDIPLSSVLKEALEGKHGLIASQLDGTHMTESVFARLYESYINQAECRMNGVNQKRWYGLTKEHKAIIDAGGKLPAWKTFFIRPYDLRHTFCTMLYEMGVDLKSAQKWMGHEDDGITRKVYTHLSKEKEKESAELFLSHDWDRSQNGSQPENTNDKNAIT